MWLIFYVSSPLSYQFFIYKYALYLSCFFFWIAYSSTSSFCNYRINVEKKNLSFRKKKYQAIKIVYCDLILTVN